MIKAESRMEDLFDWIQNLIEMVKFLNRVVENDNSPKSHIKLLTEVLNTQLPFV